MCHKRAVRSDWLWTVQIVHDTRKSPLAIIILPATTTECLFVDLAGRPSGWRDATNNRKLCVNKQQQKSTHNAWMFAEPAIAKTNYIEIWRRQRKHNEHLLVYWSREGDSRAFLNVITNLYSIFFFSLSLLNHWLVVLLCVCVPHDDLLLFTKYTVVNYECGACVLNEWDWRWRLFSTWTQFFFIIIIIIIMVIRCRQCFGYEWSNKTYTWIALIKTFLPQLKIKL